MKKFQMKVRFSLFILLLLFGCDKKEAGDFSVETKLVDEAGVVKNAFSPNDSIRFKVYLTNNSGIDAKYIRPCLQNYLILYKEDSDGNYVYYGKPKVLCTDDLRVESIQDEETKCVWEMPWISNLGFPEKVVGKFYAGDSFTLNIQDSVYEFMERVYFEVK
jgi:hypothetical protein